MLVQIIDKHCDFYNVMITPSVLLLSERYIRYHIHLVPPEIGSLNVLFQDLIIVDYLLNILDNAWEAKIVFDIIDRPLDFEI